MVVQQDLLNLPPSLLAGLALVGLHLLTMAMVLMLYRTVSRLRYTVDGNLEVIARALRSLWKHAQAQAKSTSESGSDALIKAQLSEILILARSLSQSHVSKDSRTGGVQGTTSSESRRKSITTETGRQTYSLPIKDEDERASNATGPSKS